MIEKGIILAGGSGSRLYPLTCANSKQLQPIYDKPMIYYPLSTLMLGGVRKICVITTPQDMDRFQTLLGDGHQWGIELTYRVQPEPKGIAQAFLIARDFIEGQNVALILGDNIFYGQFGLPRIFAEFESGGLVFAYRVQDPERYGLVEFDADNKALNIEEKPKHPRSDFAVPGLYLYDRDVVGISERLTPSPRGELEITDVNMEYLRQGRLQVSQMGRGIAWLDTGTPASLHNASAFVQIIESRQGMKICCPEEVAYRRGFISREELLKSIQRLPQCDYRVYLENMLDS